MAANLSTPEVIESSAAAQLRRAEKAYSALAYVAIAILWLREFVGILKLNNGTFLYTLDDAFIHLAVSDQIRHGNYGLSSGTHAAPCSSVLFPFLLAPFSGTRIHAYVPLILNTACLFATIEVLRRFLLRLKLCSDDLGPLLLAPALVLSALYLNLVGVVFSGMEHSLQLLVVVWIIYLLAQWLDSGRISAWLPVLLVISPLVRYEGVPLSLAAMLMLAVRGYKRVAAAAFAAMAVSLGSFSLFLVKLGLPPLPSSVMVKSAVALQSVGHSPFMLFSAMANNFTRMERHSTGILLLLIAICAAVRSLLLRRVAFKNWTSEQLMLVPILFVIIGHAAAGQFGWLDRYELYALLATLLLVLYVARGTIQSALANLQDRSVYIAGAAAMLIVVGGRYADATRLVPLASNNVYEQQYQMRRFVHDYYRGPVAVNDLGLVSYHNPNTVLDLWGLGSERARVLAANGATPAIYRDLVSTNGVHLVLIYDEWFQGRIPAEWQKIATLSLSRAQVSSGCRDVQFYATDGASALNVKSELQAFRIELPARVRLSIY